MDNLKSLLNKIQDERFVHNISELTYDRLFALWHISPKIERQLSGIVSKVVIGLFFIRYLTHMSNTVMKEANIKNRLTSKDLSDNKKIASIAKKLNKSDKFKSLLEKEILPQLIEIIETTGAKDLTDLSKLAHSGDYLSLALDDMKVIEDYDYNLWLEAVPEYYDNDLRHMRLKKKPVTINKSSTRKLTLEKWVTNLNKHTPLNDAVLTNGKTFSIRTMVKERRRPLLGFNRWVKEETRMLKSI